MTGGPYRTQEPTVIERETPSEACLWCSRETCPKNRKRCLRTYYASLFTPLTDRPRPVGAWGSLFLVVVMVVLAVCVEAFRK